MVIWNVPDTADMARACGYALWGYSPDGLLRISAINGTQPTGVMSHDEISIEFHRRFYLEPIRPGSQAFEIRCRKWTEESAAALGH